MAANYSATPVRQVVKRHEARRNGAAAHLDHLHVRKLQRKCKSVMPLMRFMQLLLIPTVDGDRRRASGQWFVVLP